MESYEIKLVDEIGFYDAVCDSFFNLSPFAYMHQSSADSLEKIVLYCSVDKKEIIGVELLYMGHSTGVYQGIGYKINPKCTIVIDIANDPIESIYGCFIGNRILQMVFELKSGKEEGFMNDKEYTNKQSTHFRFKKGELIGFKLAFNSSLTFLSPILAEEDKYDFNEMTNIISSKTPLGKSFSDSISFSLPQDIKDESLLMRIEMFHDGNLLMGIQSTYQLSNKQLKSVLLGKKSALSEVLELNEKDNESIQSITIHSGDMIDGIMLTTSKGNTIISGGIGGGPHAFSISDIMSKFNLNKSSFIRFIGFEGKTNQKVIHGLKLLFKNKA